MPPEDRALFPTDTEGVAQGCPLSALAGNIVLHDFDQELNQRGLVCIRYIDDFILMGKEKRQVERGMAAAKAMLVELGMDAYDPRTNPEKAFEGPIQMTKLAGHTPHVFLGHELIPGYYAPAEKARMRFKQSIETLIREGQATIDKVAKGRALGKFDRSYSETLVAIKHAAHGWRRTYKMSDCPEVFEGLNDWLARRVGDFGRYLDTHAPASQQRLRLSALGVEAM